MVQKAELSIRLFHQSRQSKALPSVVARRFKDKAFKSIHQKVAVLNIPLHTHISSYNPVRRVRSRQPTALLSIIIR